MEEKARRIDRENLTRRAVKPMPRPAVNSRPAFGEVGNQVQMKFQSNNLPNLASGKAVVINPKILNDLQKPKPIVATTVTKKVEIANKENKNTFKRQESNLIKLKVKDPVPKIIEEKSYSSKQLIHIIDVDDAERDDPMLVTEYIKDIMTYLLELETKYSIREGFLTENHKTSPRMRTVLVNWMSEVHLNFKFLSESFHLSVAIVDRYLQDNKNIGRDSLQLVGTAALLVAGKYEEMYLPDISDFVYICDDTFSKREILSMELDILKKLKFSFGRPLSLHFLRRYNKVAQVNSQHHVLGKYLLELALLEYGTCHINPSIQAAAACCLSMAILNDIDDPRRTWNKQLNFYSSYNYSDIKSTIYEFAAALIRVETSKYKSIRMKFAASSFMKISVNPKLKGTLVKKLATHAKLIKI